MTVQGRIGTAGWSIPPQHAEMFPLTGTHLHRYAERLGSVEINSSFYRPHRPQTYARWAASVPDEFRFSVKVPREITHVRRLAASADLLAPFLVQVASLGHRIGPLLVQLPPSLSFDPVVAGAFLDRLRARFDGLVALEPRHPAWFTRDADALLSEHRVARVAADPACVPLAAHPGGWPGLVYIRLHGSPHVYYSGYDDTALEGHAATLREASSRGAAGWCILDNTARGAAAHDAISLARKLSAQAGTASDADA